MAFNKLTCILIASIWLLSCAENTNNKDTIDPNAPNFSLLTSEVTGITFKNRCVESVNRNINNYDYFYNGSGVAIGDINNDGLADIFFASNDAENKLYLNKGNFKFEDISLKAGIGSTRWSTGVTMIDINEDGFLDIYVCNSGPYLDDKSLSNELFLNDGDLTFTESAEDYGIADASYSSQSTFFDMDKDGDLDLFVMNHSLRNYGIATKTDWYEALAEKEPKVIKKSCSTLFRNEGNGKYKDITEAAGLFRPGFGLGVAISDFDENGYPDIYVANDYFIPDFMFFNNGDGTFRENLKGKASHCSYYSMGCDAADFNNDGLIDLAVVDMTPSDHYRNKTLMQSMDVRRFSLLVDEMQYAPQYMFNTLQLNRSFGNFSEIANMSGVAQTDWSWTVLFADLNNSGRKDLLITNGFKRDTKDQDWIHSFDTKIEEEGNSRELDFEHIKQAKSTPIANYVYENTGALKFKDQSSEWGFDQTSFTQGAAYGDLDNDGDLDLVMNNLDQEAFVYRNNTIEKGGSHYIQFELIDGSNSGSVLNSQIKIYSGSQSQLVEYHFVRGYLSSMQPLAHFGLGQTEFIEKVEIKWTDGTVSTINNPEIDKKHILDKQNLKSQLPVPKNEQASFMNIADQAALGKYKHEENEYNDFATEVLLPHKQSTLGPCIAVGDVNGDGLDDFYIGGAKGQMAQLYMQSNGREMILNLTNDFAKDEGCEDLGAEFLDVDGDGDIDLYVASGGGGAFKLGSPLLQDRLYLNSGNGTFKKSNSSLPKITSSTACVLSTDWDADGDLDLFVGGRTKPGKYPQAPTSYLLENNNGKFINRTASLAPELENAGMVTDASWSDIDNDGRPDLIVVGEWMPIMTFMNTPDGFVSSANDNALADAKGWWYSIEEGDFDKDGDIDFIVGNVGLNNKFHPNKEKPLHVYSNDFDNNGTLDIVLSKYYKGNLTPTRGKECSTQQMPFIEAKFPLYSSFASSTLEDIYGTESLDASLHYEANQFASVILKNNGDGTFELKELPIIAQLSPINDIVIWDFDKDGNEDVVIAGAMYNTEVETPAYDAGKGLFLRGNGDGTFEPISICKESGLFIPQNVKEIELMLIGPKKMPSILVANNDGYLQLFLWRK